MRLWSISPRYLDPAGLVALWREALLAQKVLRGGTRGYTNHPQLWRFRRAPAPSLAIAAYLQAVWQEAERRGYRFDASRISPGGAADPIPVARGQLDYELALLRLKFLSRHPQRHAELLAVLQAEPHPCFTVVPGGVEGWERVRPDVLSR